MKYEKLLSVVLAVFILLSMGSVIFAEEKKIDLQKDDGIREILNANIGKRVSVRTGSGEALEGSVETVGTQLVHISKLSGRDFYDAVVRIDRIDAVVLRVRGK